MSADSKVQLVAVRAEDSSALYVDYVFRLFARTRGWNLTICSPAKMPGALSSGRRPRVLIMYAEPADFKPLLEQTEQSFEFAILVERSGFFGPTFLELPDLPARPQDLIDAASLDGFSRHSFHLRPRVVQVRLDLIASAFWFLARYEEYITSTPDQHGRFLCAHSIAPPEMYDQPLVNMWFERLHSEAAEALGEDHRDRPGHHPTFALTHDVDLMRKYRGLRGVRRAISTMISADTREATGEIRLASLVLAGIRRDPYDSFDELFSLKEKIAAPSTFFLMGGGNAPLDADYNLDDNPTRELISRIRGCGDEIGVHPSYETHRSPEMLADETRALSEGTGMVIEGARQHYLRFAVPETWHAQTAANLRYDSSLGFADRAGFRCGWSGCFHPFDIDKREELPIIEIPLVAMDVTLAIYEKLSAEHSLERLAKLLAASETRGGVFVLLWHNILRDKRVFPGFWDSLEYFVFASAGSARFTTLGRLCDEFESMSLRII